MSVFQLTGKKMAESADFKQENPSILSFQNQDGIHGSNQSLKSQQSKTWNRELAML